MRRHAAGSTRAGAAVSGSIGRSTSHAPASAHARAFASQRSVEQTYQRKTPVEHVLLRPGMYIGSEKPTKGLAWVYDGKRRAMVHKEVSYVPGLLKIFDEILVNACDNKQRDKAQTRVEVTISPGDASGTPAEVSVYNDGRGIPVQLHRKEGVYVPELVLGTLLTGSNFDDGVARLTGGRYGYGAKLTNIFSDEFTVETADTKAGLLYRQTWSSNMSTKSEPEITRITPGDGVVDHTRVTFRPDLSRFALRSKRIDAGTLALMRRRVQDVAGTTDGVEVHLDGKRIPVGSFTDYMGLYFKPHRTGNDAAGAGAVDVGDGDDMNVPPPVHARLNKHMEVGVGVSTRGRHDIDGAVAVSFVNSMATPRGGSHVAVVVDDLSRRLATLIRKRHPDMAAAVTPAVVRSKLHVFVNCHVPNPSFDSQSKDRLDTPADDFGFNVRLTDKFVRQVATDAGVERAVVASLRSKEDAATRRKASRARDARVRLVPKLEDANHAGTRKAPECTLILTEGDSAKALAVAGLAVVGRDRYGVFPLRGKLLNVRDVKLRTALANEEIAHLVSILGLDFAQSYAGVPREERGLRYGRVMIMADQDHDGSHIKGLIVNLFHHYWPALLREDGFLEQFVTPVIKARRKGKRRGSGSGGDGDGGDVREFFSIADFDAWHGTLRPSEAAQWRVKYYKGLGTSTAAEGRAYFSDLPRHRRAFVWGGDGDGDRIDMAFSKARVESRKAWLLGPGGSGATAAGADPDVDTDAGRVPDADGNDDVDADDACVSYGAFIDRELIEFSRADLVRSIPSVVDGLKPSQRKVLFACFKRGLTQELKVAQLAGYCSEHTGYHHGEASLHATIVKMAQDFVGSNNLPLLQPIGQFGTRLRGGRDAASARYIFTRLSPMARLLFPAADDAVLQRCSDDGHLVEPVWYVPVVPLVLLNGADGIGTGWSTHVPPHHPVQVVDALFDWIDRHVDADGNLRDASSDATAPARGGASSPLLPWAKGFAGRIEPLPAGGGFVSVGSAQWVEPTASSTTASSSSSAAAKGKGRRGGKGGASGAAEPTDIRITELPLGKWTDDYKQFLVGLATKGVLRTFKEYHTETTADFLLRLAKGGREALLGDDAGAGLDAGADAGATSTDDDADDDDVSDADDAPQASPSAAVTAGDPRLEAALKLRKNISTRNMHLFDAQGRIRLYATAEEVVDDFARVRLALYARRKAWHESVLQSDLGLQRNRLRFLSEVTDGSLVLADHTRAGLDEVLAQRGYDTKSALQPRAAAAGVPAIADGDDSGSTSSGDGGHGGGDDGDSGDGTPRALAASEYGYLVNAPVWQLTGQHLTSAAEAVSTLEAELEALRATQPQDMWRKDLAALKEALLEDPAFG